MSELSVNVSRIITGNVTDLTRNKLRNFDTLSIIEQTIFKASYFLYINKYGSLISNVTLVLIAISIIVYASNASLVAPKNSAKVSKSHPDYKKLKSDHKAISENLMTEKFAFITPIVCGIALVSLYYALKHLDPSKVSKFLSHYTVGISLFAFHQLIGHTLRILFLNLEQRWNVLGSLTRLRLTLSEEKENADGSSVELNYLYRNLKGEQPFLDELEDDFDPPEDVKSEAQFANIGISTLDVASIVASFYLSYLFYKNKQSLHWLFSNFVAWSFAFEGIVRLRLNSFKTGVILLSGLFFYDIYFVFGSNIMVSVATSIEIPVMMKLPSGFNHTNYTVDFKQPDFIVPNLPLSMLGLGDIVVPGSFIALLLRFDLFRHHESHQTPYKYLNRFDTTYFKSGLLSYVVGLVLTFVGLHYSNQPQPALLYLSPSLLLGLVITGYLKGDLLKILTFKENDDDTKKKNSGEKTKKKDQNESDIPSDSVSDESSESEVKVQDTGSITD